MPILDTNVTPITLMNAYSLLILFLNNTLASQDDLSLKIANDFSTFSKPTLMQNTLKCSHFTFRKIK